MKLKYVLIAFLLTLLFSVNAEVVGNPMYNYSINPLLGSMLLEYEDESDLMWNYDDGGVGYGIKAWEGSQFSDVNQMFNELTKDLKATGDCVKFDYLGMEGIIGEVSINMSARNNIGWMIFLNGAEFDYYLMAFTLEENYERYYSEIQSFLDSFSAGDEGALMPGPISAFFGQSPQNVSEEFVFDFFNTELKITSSRLNFSAAQTVIEREANVMLNYSNNPELFYEAWARYYQLVFRDNYTRLEPLYQSLVPYFAGEEFTDYKITENLMFWIQHFTYARQLDSTSDLLNPIESVLTQTGDCDSRSLILGILLHKFGINSLLLTSEKVKHALIAVDCPGEGATYEFNDKKYLTVELTAEMLIGEISEKHADPSLWTPIEMEYTNGY